MNILFFDILSNHKNIKIEYSGLGGLTGMVVIFLFILIKLSDKFFILSACLFYYNFTFLLK